MSRSYTGVIARDFFDRFGGKLVAGDRVRVAAESGLAKLNQGLHMEGGWFSEKQVLFFAEGIPTFDDIPDYFYIDTDDDEPRPIRYFHLTPTDLGVCAVSLDKFVQGIWNLASTEDRHYFPHTTPIGLQTIIRKAFEDVPKPDEAQISNFSGPEADSTVRFFQRRSWQHLEPEDLNESEGLNFLTPEAWHYFLPAFLLATVEHPDSDLAIDTMIHLQAHRAKKREPGLAEFYRRRWERLTDQQVSVLKELFAWMNAVSAA